MSERLPLVKFAAFTAVCLGFSAWLIAVIGNISLQDRTPYQAVFSDVTGLLVNDDVKISGVTIGKVTGIDVVDGGDALVTFEVDDDVRLGPDSDVTIRWRDVFGLRFLYLDPAGGEPVEAMHRFPVDQTSAPSDLGLLLQRITPFMQALDPETQNQVLQALSEALVGREQQVQELIADGGELLQTVGSRDEEISRLLRNSETIFDAYAAREDQLRGLLDSFAEVSETVADRNDTLDTSIAAIADAQQELRRFVDANDEEIRGTLDAAEDITDVLAVNHENLEEVLETSSRGFVAYHLISRIGQWFNIRAVGASSDYEPVSTERGANLPQPEDRKCFDGSDDCKPSEDGDGQSSSAALHDVFGAPRPEGR